MDQTGSCRIAYRGQCEKHLSSLSHKKFILLYRKMKLAIDMSVPYEMHVALPRTIKLRTAASDSDMVVSTAQI